MRVERRAALACAALACAGSIGCGATLAPRHWLPTAREAQREGYGGWITARTEHGATLQTLSGELLAISDDSVLVLTSGGAVGAALADVRSATLEAYDTQSGDVGKMTLAGAVTSISTGAGLLLVAPLWIVTGTIATSAIAARGRHEVREADRAGSGAGETRGNRASWMELRLFARFPQGIPPGLDVSRLELAPANRHPRPTGTKPGTIVSH